MDVGKRIKKIRTDIGMSADQLAEKLGKNRSTIYRYESGDIENMPIDVLQPIADALNTTPAHLMGWDVEEINEVSSIQEDASSYSDSSEEYLKNVMLEISEMGFTNSEIQRIRDYAHALKDVENTSNEVHEAFIELFVNMYKLDLSVEDVKDIYTYAQFLKTKHN